MSKSPRKKRFRNNGHQDLIAERQGGVAGEVGVYLTGDYEQRTTGMSQAGVSRVLNVGNFALYGRLCGLLRKIEKYNENRKGSK